jgi:hypothetical protein
MIGSMEDQEVFGRVRILDERPSALLPTGGDHPQNYYEAGAQTPTS